MVQNAKAFVSFLDNAKLPAQLPDDWLLPPADACDGMFEAALRFMNRKVVNAAWQTFALRLVSSMIKRDYAVSRDLADQLADGMTRTMDAHIGSACVQQKACSTLLRLCYHSDGSDKLKFAEWVRHMLYKTGDRLQRAAQFHAHSASVQKHACELIALFASKQPQADSYDGNALVALAIAALSRHVDNVDVVCEALRALANCTFRYVKVGQNTEEVSAPWAGVLTRHARRARVACFEALERHMGAAYDCFYTGMRDGLLVLRWVAGNSFTAPELSVLRTLALCRLSASRDSSPKFKTCLPRCAAREERILDNMLCLGSLVTLAEDVILDAPGASSPGRDAAVVAAATLIADVLKSERLRCAWLRTVAVLSTAAASLDKSNTLLHVVLAGPQMWVPGGHDDCAPYCVTEFAQLVSTFLVGSPTNPAPRRVAFLQEQVVMDVPLLPARCTAAVLPAMMRFARRCPDRWRINWDWQTLPAIVDAHPRTEELCYGVLALLASLPFSIGISDTFFVAVALCMEAHPGAQCVQVKGLAALRRVIYNPEFASPDARDRSVKAVSAALARWPADAELQRLGFAALEHVLQE